MPVLRLMGQQVLARVAGKPLGLRPVLEPPQEQPGLKQIQRSASARASRGSA